MDDKTIENAFMSLGCIAGIIEGLRLGGVQMPEKDINKLFYGVHMVLAEGAKAIKELREIETQNVNISMMMGI